MDSIENQNEYCNICKGMLGKYEKKYHIDCKLEIDRFNYESNNKNVEFKIDDIMRYLHSFKIKFPEKLTKDGKIPIHIAWICFLWEEGLSKEQILKFCQDNSDIINMNVYYHKMTDLIFTFQPGELECSVFVDSGKGREKINLI